MYFPDLSRSNWTPANLAGLAIKSSENVIISRCFTCLRSLRMFATRESIWVMLKLARFLRSYSQHNLAHKQVDSTKYISSILGNTGGLLLVFLKIFILFCIGIAFGEHWRCVYNVTEQFCSLCKVCLPRTWYRTRKPPFWYPSLLVWHQRLTKW